MQLDHRLVADRDRPGAWFVRSDGADQSFVDPDDPTYLEFYYVQRIADVIDTSFAPGQRIRAIHIGGAGMTIPRYIAHTRPTSAQIVFEPDTSLTEAVRQAIPLPKRSGIKVRPVDGLSGLSALRDSFAELAVVDAYLQAQVPAELATSQCQNQLKRVLGPSGTMVMNTTDHAPFAYARRLVASVCHNFATVALACEPAVWRGRRFGNLVVAAGQINLEGLAERARLAAFGSRLIAGPELVQWIGSAKPFTTEDSLPSPPPPGGWMGVVPKVT